MRVESKGRYYRLSSVNPMDATQGGNFKKVTLMSNVKCHREAKGDPTGAELKYMVKRWSWEKVRGLSSEKKGQEARLGKASKARKHLVQQ